MRLTIQRGPSTDAGTFSKARLDIGVVFDWAELPDRGNAPGLSCIPVGVYDWDLVDSPHFGFKVWRARDVPGRSFIEIHPANWAGDTTKGLYSDLLGCMAPGHGTGLLAPPGHPAQMAILQSRPAFQNFMAITTAGAAPTLTTEILAFVPLSQ